MLFDLENLKRFPIPNPIPQFPEIRAHKPEVYRFHGLRRDFPRGNIVYMKKEQGCDILRL
jgi:hypothetical protein